MEEPAIRDQIADVRKQIEHLKLALPESTMDDRAFAAVRIELRSKHAELNALQTHLKRIRLVARAEASRIPRRNANSQQPLGRVVFKHARAAR